MLIIYTQDIVLILCSPNGMLQIIANTNIKQIK